MPTFDRFLLAHFLPKLLGQACPSTVHRSGAEGQKVNCFTTTIPKQDGEPDLVLLSIQGAQVEGLRYDGHRYSIPVAVPLTDIDPGRLHVTHFYGLAEVRYVGVWDIARGFWTRWPYVLIHLQRFGNAALQRLFNRRALEIRRRLDILRDVVNATLGDADAVDALDLMTLRYGSRWADHPGWRTHHDLLDQHLEFLVDSGELKKFDTRYKPTGQALKTLYESEEQDRKHSANIRVQLLLAVLALAAAVMAAAQAGVVKLPTLLDLTGGEAAEKSTGAPQQAVTVPAGTTTLFACTPIAPASGAASAAATVQR